MTVNREQRCPHIVKKAVGDEAYDLCGLTERPSGRIKSCLLESGESCEVWNEIQGEWAKEVKDE